MNRFFLIIGAFVILFSACNNNDGYTYAEIETDFGTMKVKLYNSTPKHRDNFIKLANEGFYDDLLFHRVIKGFMIQGGDPNSRDAASDAQLGGGGPGYLTDAEIGALHIKGALAAARTTNPEKRSSGSQFYIVQGTQQTEAALNALETRKKIKYSAEQRELYKTLGGSPTLDNEYTVFGEVVEGIEVIDEIAEVKTTGVRPIEDVKMKVKILN